MVWKEMVNQFKFYVFFPSGSLEFLLKKVWMRWKHSNIAAHFNVYYCQRLFLLYQVYCWPSQRQASLSRRLTPFTVVWFHGWSQVPISFRNCLFFCQLPLNCSCVQQCEGEEPCLSITGAGKVIYLPQYFPFLFQLLKPFVVRETWREEAEKEGCSNWEPPHPFLLHVSAHLFPPSPWLAISRCLSHSPFTIISYSLWGD